MKQVSYNPPVGSPPFVFAFGGGKVVLQPPDQWWKETEETYEMAEQGKKVGDKFVPTGRKVYRRRRVWVVDEEKNKDPSAGRPTNSMFMSNEMLRVAKRGIVQNKEFLEVTSVAQGLHHAELSRLKKEADAKLEAERQSHEEKLKEAVWEMQQQREERLAEAKAAAEESGYDIEEIRKEILKKKQAAARKKAGG